MAVSFGVTSTGGYGVAQSVKIRTQAEIADARNEVGLVTNQQAYSRTKEVTQEFLYNGTEPDAAGETVEIAGMTGLITESETSQTNTAYKTGTVTIQKKDSAELVALA